MLWGCVVAMQHLPAVGDREPGNNEECTQLNKVVLMASIVGHQVLRPVQKSYDVPKETPHPLGS